MSCKSLKSREVLVAVLSILDSERPKYVFEAIGGCNST